MSCLPFEGGFRHLRGNFSTCRLVSIWVGVRDSGDGGSFGDGICDGWRAVGWVSGWALVAGDFLCCCGSGAFCRAGKVSGGDAALYSVAAGDDLSQRRGGDTGRGGRFGSGWICFSSDARSRCLGIGGAVDCGFAGAYQHVPASGPVSGDSFVGDLGAAAVAVAADRLGVELYAGISRRQRVPCGNDRKKSKGVDDSYLRAWVESGLVDTYAVWVGQFHRYAAASDSRTEAGWLLPVLRVGCISSD